MLIIENNQVKEVVESKTIISSAQVQSQIDGLYSLISGHEIEVDIYNGYITDAKAKIDEHNALIEVLNAKKLEVIQLESELN